MDQALKQRMVGATVLIALGVIFLPIFIGGSSDEEVTIQNDEFLIPPQPQVGDSDDGPGRRLPLVQPAPVTRDNAGNDTEVDLSSGEIRLPLPNESMPDNGTADSGGDSNGGVLADTSDAPVVDLPAIDTPDTSTDTVAVLTPPDAGADTAANDIDADSNTTAGTPSVANPDPFDLENRWRVQVASLGNPENATRLMNQIESLGFPAHSQVITRGGVTLHRVLAGPFFNEAEANVAVTGIRRADDRLNPQVLGPADTSEPSTPAATTSAAPVPGGLDRYAVQAGVFSSMENAEQLVERLTNAGYAAYSERIGSNGQSLFRVRIGPLLSDADAGNIATRIENDLGINGIVVDYP